MGYFEEINDVSTFIFDGYDQNGLKKWLRQKGSVRNENYHQKMKTAIGPWGIGAATSHMIIVLLTYRYNIKTGVRRCGEHEFRHPWLDIIDRIQNRVQEIYNVIIYPRHKNLSAFVPIPDFTSVGIGPVCLSEHYVAPGKPAQNLI